MRVDGEVGETFLLAKNSIYTVSIVIAVCTLLLTSLVPLFSQSNDDSHHLLQLGVDPGFKTHNNFIIKSSYILVIILVQN